MSTEYKNLCDYLNAIRERIHFSPKIAIVLGSGLDGLCDFIDIKHSISYSDIDNFPVTTNEMHKGRFIFGYIENVPIVAMQGRLHYYEGYTMNEVVAPIRLMRMLGAQKLILSNAVGGISEHLDVGDLMLIKDHISCFIPSPLIGENIKELGTRFPDMTDVYDKNLREKITQIASDIHLDLKQGVFLQTTGPNYETPSEIRAYQTLGADAVGMSTACEAMAAVHCGFQVCGISCITNKAAGITGQPLSDEEVGIIASKASDKFCKLVKQIVISI